MSEFVASYPWALPILGLLIGIVLGAVGAQMFERKRTGGRTVDVVQHEMDEYKEEVGKHFATTSELFRDMTEKYRDVYNHLASGSQALCEDEIAHSRLEFAEAKSIEVDDTPVRKPNRVEDEVMEEAPEVTVSAVDGSQKAAPTRNDPPLKT